MKKKRKVALPLSPKKKQNWKGRHSSQGHFSNGSTVSTLLNAQVQINVSAACRSDVLITMSMLSLLPSQLNAAIAEFSPHKRCSGSCRTPLTNNSHLPVAPKAEPRVIEGWRNSALVKVRLHTLASHCKKHKFLSGEMHLCVSKVHLPSLLPCWILFLAPPAGNAWMGCFICHLSLGSVSLRKSVSKMKGKAWSLILKELISLLKCIFLSSSIFLPPPILKWGAFLSFFFLLITVKLSGSFIPPFQA